jgi:hypothetical protein
VLDSPERAVLRAELNDLGCQFRTDERQACQLTLGSGVDVKALLFMNPSPIAVQQKHLTAAVRGAITKREQK